MVRDIKLVGFIICLVLGIFINSTLLQAQATVDLSTHFTGPVPTGAVLQWHGALPLATPLTASQVAAAPAGAYYAVFKDMVNNCYSPVTAFAVATNVCPANTVNLALHSSDTPPAGAVLEWHNALPLSAANKMTAAQIATAGAGTYYATFFDSDNGCYSPEAAVIVTISVCNVAPLAMGDIAITPQNKPISGNVLINDNDPEGGILTVTTTPTTPPTKGTVVLNANGTYTYTPSPTATGEDVFCYELKDALGLKDTACVSINIIVSPVTGNNWPVASNDNSQTTQDKFLVLNVKANDKDLEDATLGNPVGVTTPTNGGVIYNADGTVTYTPNPGFVGKDSFSYKLCDSGSPSLCDTATVTIEVLPMPAAGNQAPVAIADIGLSKIGTSITGNVATNDSDPTHTSVQLSYAKVTDPSNGSITFNADGSYTYTPNASFVGSDYFTYKVCDSGSPALCDTTTISVAILPKLCLMAKVYLQGALFGVYLPDSLMRDDLRTKGYLPTSSPYPAMGLTGITNANTSTAAVVGAGSASGKDAIVDWVFVELRSGADSTLVVDSRSALLQRDGDVVDVDGVSPVRFDQAGSGIYYLAIKHRNHLGVMSKKIALSGTCTTIDFRKVSTLTFSFNSSSAANQSQVVVEQGLALWSGNALYTNAGDGKVEVMVQGTDNDVNMIYQQIVNASGNVFVSPFYKLRGYYSGDVNLDGEALLQSTNNDVEFIYQNVIKNHTGNGLVLPFFKIRQQIP